MIERTEIILSPTEKDVDELVAEINDTLPLSVGDKFYYSVREFYPRDEKEYRIENYHQPNKLTEMYLGSIMEKCDKYHIKEFEVVEISKSLREDYSKGLNDSNKLHEFYTSIIVKPTK